MAVHYRTLGFCIKKVDRGDADQLLTFYTENYGKLEILGKAIRKIKSKLRGGADLFYLSEIEFIQGKNQKTLTDAILMENFLRVRKNPERLEIAGRIATTLDRLVVKEEQDEKVWQLLEDVFKKLNSLSKVEELPEGHEGKIKIFYYYFFWHLVSILGYQPEIQGCAIGGKEVDCDIIKILKVIFKKDWPILSRLKLEPAHLKLLKDVSEWYNEEIIR